MSETKIAEDKWCHFFQPTQISMFYLLIPNLVFIPAYCALAFTEVLGHSSNAAPLIPPDSY